MTEQTKLEGYCIALYDKFMSEADSEDPTTGLVVWRGHITKAARDMGLPEGTYRRAIETLVSLNCIEQVERGYRGKSFSVFILHRAPTSDVWADRVPSQGRSGLTKPVNLAILARRVSDLEGRLEGIDIKQALFDLQQEINSVKATQN